ncbi:unnamed protein product [Prorocentrum cordatum]|uniref:C3H1-type domain-containing protein n=1 Tax=Prorocentrum cordatum TaxID=2364126 RepID=A0ABN9UA03_9DINO|nr:unnamed protein product [Polarella glacialis]
MQLLVTAVVFDKAALSGDHVVLDPRLCHHGALPGQQVQYVQYVQPGQQPVQQVQYVQQPVPQVQYVQQPVQQAAPQVPVCVTWRSTGSCTFGDFCQYRHGPDQARRVWTVRSKGSEFYASVVQADSFWRREAAIFIAQVTCWRLCRVRRSFVMSLKDMTNAFGSSDWSELEITIAHSTSEANRALCQQRYEDSMIELTADEGPLLVKPFQGGVMGGPFTVAAFLGTFSRATLQWAYQWSRSDPMSRFLVSKWLNFQSDLSLLKYADDVNKTVVASDEMTLGDLFRKVRKMDEVFDSVMKPFGHVQNLGKQEFLTYFASQGNRARQVVRKGIEGIQGKIKDSVRKRDGDTTPPPSAGAAGSGGQPTGGSGNEHAKKGDGEGNKDVAKVVAQVVRLLLTVTRELGDAASVVFLRWDIALDRGLPACLSAAGNKYDEQSKDMRATQQAGEEQDFKRRGPPHLQIFVSAMQYCATRTPTAGSTEEVAKQLAQDSKEWWQQYMSEDISLKVIGRAVPYFRCKPLKKENRAIIMMRTDFNKAMGVEASRILEAVIEAEGGEFLLASKSSTIGYDVQ